MTGGGLRAVSRRAATLLVAVVVVLLGASPADAHSELERSDPPNGGMVEPGRDFLTLWFGEEISASASRFDLHLADGTGVDAATSSVDGGTVVHLETAALERGSYELTWRVVALDDGHPSSGTLVFGVGMRPDVLPSAGGALPAGPLVAVRWLDLSAVMLALGAMAVSGRVLEQLGEAGRRARRQARVLAVVASCAAVYTGLLTPFLRARRPGNPVDVWFSETWTTLTDTPWGHVWLAREAVVVVVAAAAWTWARSDGTARGWRRTALVALLLVSVLEARAGHAADVSGDFGAAVLASAVHLVAAGIWAGGVVTLVLCLVPAMRRSPDLRGPALSTVWRGYSPMFAAASVVLVATGLYEAGLHIPDPGLAGSTVYGAVVAAKTLLVVVALLLAGVNTLLVHPVLADTIGRRLGRRPGWAPVDLRRFTSVVTAEAVVLVVAVAAASVVTSVPTAREVAAASQTAAPHHEEVNGLYITFEGVPRGPEQVSLLVRVRPTVFPEPGPVTQVSVALDGGTGAAGATDALVLTPLETGRYEAEVRWPEPGSWTATVTVLREGQPDAVSHARWTIADPDAGSRPAFRTFTAAAAAVLLALLTAVVWWRRRRHAGWHSPALDQVRARERSSR